MVTLPTIEIKEKPSDASVSEAADTVHDLERIREEFAAIKHKQLSGAIWLCDHFEPLEAL